MKNHTITITLITFLFCSVVNAGGYGSRGDRIEVNNRPEVNSDARATARQGQTQGQTQGQSMESHNRNTNSNVNSTINAVEVDTRNTVNATVSSSSGGNRLSVDGGRHEASATAGGGSSEATGGNSLSNIEIDASDTMTAASAASVYAAYCTQSASGQATGGGAAVAIGDQVCDHLKIADRELLAYQQQVQWCKEGSEACDPPAKLEHLANYNEHLRAAEELVENTEITGAVNRVSGQLALPAAILWVLFLL